MVKITTEEKDNIQARNVAIVLGEHSIISISGNDRKNILHMTSKWLWWAIPAMTWPVLKILDKKAGGKKVPELHYEPWDILLIQHKHAKAKNQVQIDRLNLFSSSMKKESDYAFAPQKQLPQPFSNWAWDNNQQGKNSISPKRKKKEQEWNRTLKCKHVMHVNAAKHVCQKWQQYLERYICTTIKMLHAEW